MKFWQIRLIASMTALALSGCAVEKEATGMQSNALLSIRAASEAQPVQTISTTQDSWLMGQALMVAAPASPMLSKEILYHPAQRVALADVTSYISQSTGLIIDISEIMQSQIGAVTGSAAAANTPAGTAPISPVTMPAGTGKQTMSQNEHPMSISYEGRVSGLLDVVANNVLAWWKYADGKVIFYRTETKTFYLPAIARKSTGESVITTSSSNSTGGGATSSGTTTAATSGATINSTYSIDVWGDLVSTAKTVGSGAQVVVNTSAGSLTVTGTPAQVRAVKEWIADLAIQLNQQVAITVHVYSVKITKGDTYNFDPTVLFAKAAGTYGYNLSGPTALTPPGGTTPLGLVTSVLTGAPGAWGQYSGSTAAFQALSTLGNVSDVLQQTLVTLNGQPAPIQIANQQGYLASSQTMVTANVGSQTTYTPGTITTGFTATFLPRIVNGRVILNMTMTNSSLNNMTTIGTTSNGIQAPNVDLTTFQQSVSLKPGEALLLSGIQQGNSNSNHSGVGSANNVAFGGGVNSNTVKSMIAIVISAKVL
jgi:type IVB pilus formation R64 PilN family outer membrane protein